MTSQFVAMRVHVRRYLLLPLAFGYELGEGVCNAPTLLCTGSMRYSQQRQTAAA